MDFLLFHKEVADLWAGGNWDFRFGSPFNEWEMDIVQQFLLWLGREVLTPRSVIKSFGNILKTVIFLLGEVLNV